MDQHANCAGWHAAIPTESADRLLVGLGFFLRESIMPTTASRPPHLRLHEQEKSWRKVADRIAQAAVIEVSQKTPGK